MAFTVIRRQRKLKAAFLWSRTCVSKRKSPIFSGIHHFELWWGGKMDLVPQKHPAGFLCYKNSRIIRPHAGVSRSAYTLLPFAGSGSRCFRRRRIAKFENLRCVVDPLGPLKTAFPVSNRGKCCRRSGCFSLSHNTRELYDARVVLDKRWRSQ